jgi:N-acetylneuraminic acid mutarotase
MRDSPFGFIRIWALSVSVLLASVQFLHGAPAGVWSSGPDLPTGLARATGVYFPANGRFYAMGGRTSDTAGADMPTPYEYNPNNNTWAFKTAAFPDNQVSNMACGVLSVGQTPYIYCVGGSATATNAATSRVFRYDPVSDKMETAGLQPWNESAPDTLPGGFTVFQNKLYILGGLTLTTAATNRIFEFTPGNAVGSQWARKAATLPVALSFVPATTIGNHIYTAGGSTFTPCVLTETNNSYVYDPVADSIFSIANIPRTTGETRALTVGNEMWVLGGGRTAPNPSAEVNIYNPTTGQWRMGQALSAGERNFAAASDGRHVFLAGGYDSATTPLNTSHIYSDASQISISPVIIPDGGPDEE